MESGLLDDVIQHIEIEPENKSVKFRSNEDIREWGKGVIPLIQRAIDSLPINAAAGLGKYMGVIFTAVSISSISK